MTNFTIDAATLCGALATVKKVVGSSPEQVLYRTTKRGTLEVRAQSAGFLCSVTIAADIRKAARFSAPIDQLEAICKRRKFLAFTVQPGTLSYRATEGNYNGEVFLSDEAVIPVEMAEADSAVRVSAVLQDVLPLIDLKPLIPQDIVAFFSCTQGRLKAAAGDSLHAVLVDTATDAPDFTLVLPVKHQLILNSVFKQGYTARLTESHLYGSQDGVLVRVPLQAPSELTLEKVEAFVANAVAPIARFKVKVSSITDVLANIASVYDKAQKLVLTIKKASLTLSMESPTGKSSDKLPITVDKGGDATVHLNVPLLQDALTKLDADTELTVSVMDKALVLSFTQKEITGTYLVITYGDGK